ncbi:MAG TPA: N-acetylglucosamine-6-phosphate deacetylase, partial [Steroidobacteraceae bacterium]|nr:N-acetylglucosamine-6-phosphate deacetylase [Steroidobacteraceae bacterium]
NGGGGVLFNDDPSPAAIRRIGAAHRAFGTTGFLPTLISDSPKVMSAAIDAVRTAIADDDSGVLGIHLEGPLLSPARPGVHDPARFRDPDASLLDLAASLGVGRTVMTLAPERVPTAVIAELARRGLILCAGHTAADYATARAAFDAGVRGITHLFNAMPAMQNREPGLVGAALEDERVWCGLIVDGHHVHPGTLRVALAAKPKGKTFLVTDAMPTVGSSETTFYLAGQRVRCATGVCVTDGGVLAGSALDMASAVRNTVRLLGVPLEEAARMASTYPAALLGLESERGRIAAGLRADFVVLDDDLKVHQVWCGGVIADPDRSLPR